MSSEISVEAYQTKGAVEPLSTWLNKLKDKRAKAQIRARLARLPFGLLGDTKPVGNAVHELRISVGKGYRVYYANDNEKLIILLCGGDKKTQPQDIAKAKEYWNDYKARKRHC